MQDFYGDNFRWFVGMVVDVIDPLKLDRVKVRIHGVHTGNEQQQSKTEITKIKNDDLPWAQVVLPSTEPGVTGLGANVQIKNRAQVFGVFLDGKDSQHPLVLGTIPKIETEKNVTTEEVVQKSNEDVELTGSTNIEKSFYFLTSVEGGNFTPEQACGMIGNFCVESGASSNNGDINPVARSGFNNENSFGIAQWNPAKAAGNRFGELQKFSSKIGKSYRSLDAQLRFVKFELETLPFLGLGQLRNAKSFKDATLVFQNKYERPNKDLAHTDRRLAFAQETFRKLGPGATNG
tara:strand:+ start:1185 stop:2057 length:873 start_codon:yes stop_codon:yes gene_type:complete